MAGDSWFAAFSEHDAVAHVADIGYGEDMHGNPLELVPRFWDPKTGVLVFDDGRFHVKVQFQEDGTVEFVTKS